MSAEHASQDGKSAQSLTGIDIREELRGNPEAVRPVLNGVDLYISHPADSTWWRSIMEGFVRANPQLVADDIARRNATRPSRT